MNAARDEAAAELSRLKEELREVEQETEEIQQRQKLLEEQNAESQR